MTGAALQQLMRGVASGEVHDAQVAAFAMAVAIRGMDDRETSDLTLAMRDSGTVLDWTALRDRGPVLDKHSTGGVGDGISLVLAPMLAACDAFVPMLSGRGLGHTGGTLDKLAAIPGYRCDIERDALYRVVADTGLAIVGAGADLAPADRRLYAVRDVTATVDSLPLITASILSKKLAVAADVLVLDVKHGSGAMLSDTGSARALARSLLRVAQAAGQPCRALLTDMDQPLGPAIGNLLELQQCLDYLQADARPPRFHAVCLALGVAALRAAGLAHSDADAERRLLEARRSGRAAERFASMVHALGGPSDVFAWASSAAPAAPVCEPLPALCSGWLAGVDARELGMAAVTLGAGRAHPDARIDPRVGFSQVRHVGERIEAEEPLLQIHAASPEQIDRVRSRLHAAFTLAERPPVERVLIEPLESGGVGEE
ncbi:MAG: thymidine phosphorylase [Xanthomonadales bacterium]|nr:thymidine phosphorylase [Xanthomonadales bacterium]